ncbi:MAG: STAS domain-containing protein [Myxococcaceae bacterium]
MATANTGQIWVGTVGSEVFLKIEGRATHQLAPALRRCLSDLEASGAHAFRLDLGNCTYVDSTFLGVLAGCCLRLRDQPDSHFAISAISPRCLEGLRALGVERYCQMELESSPRPQALHQLPAPAATGDAWADVVLEAHQALVQVDEANAERFDDVIRMVQESLAHVQHSVDRDADAASRRVR